MIKQIKNVDFVDWYKQVYEIFFLNLDKSYYTKKKLYSMFLR